MDAAGEVLTVLVPIAFFGTFAGEEELARAMNLSILDDLERVEATLAGVEVRALLEPIERDFFADSSSLDALADSSSGADFLDEFEFSWFGTSIEEDLERAADESLSSGDALLLFFLKILNLDSIDEGPGGADSSSCSSSSLMRSINSNVSSV